MVINTTRKTLFLDYLTWLDPVFHLKEDEKTLLAAYLTLHYWNRHRFSSLVLLDDLLFSQIHTTNQLLKKYNWTQEEFNELFGTLKQKGFIEEYQDEEKDQHFKLNPVLTRYPQNEKFNINIDLKIVS